MATAYALEPPTPADDHGGDDVERTARDPDVLPPTLSFSISRTETAQSFDASATASSASGMLDTGTLSTAQVHETFLSAEHFVAAVLSRLRKDAMAIDPKLWALQDHANRLWALQQQALLGSCDTSRGSKAYLQALDTDGPATGSTGGFLWRPCCFRMMRESKIKLWQDLGDMPHEQAKLWYIHIVTDICPEWRNPLHTDSALLRTWTPDDESDECALCAEAFTFLNRRHHCRRCLSLVCAVCSPYTAPLRVFTETATTKRQRICAACFDAMGGARTLDSHRPRATKQNQMRESDYATAPTDTDIEDTQRASYASVRSESNQRDDDAASRASTASAEVAALEPAPPYILAPSSTIHCGTLEFFHGAGFRKSWHTYFFVLLLRKGSLGMFLHAADHVEKKKRPAAVFKLSGYTIRVKAQKRRPHQFRIAHATKKVLHFAAPSIEAMNVWISQFIKAIDVANELEALAPLAMARSPRRGSMAESAPPSSLLPENDFTEHDENGSDRSDGEDATDRVERPDARALDSSA